VILAVHVLTSRKLHDFHFLLQNQNRSSIKAGFWLSEPHSRHLLQYNKQRNITRRQIFTLSSPLSATFHKDRSSRCPVRYPLHITKTDPHAVQSAIRNISQRHTHAVQSAFRHLLATPVHCLRYDRQQDRRDRATVPTT
jgi:hypothetical protein